MSRPLRIQGAGLIYHVVARGNNRMKICLDALDYARFLQIWRQAITRFELDSWLICVMPNHYHLVFRTRRANLSLAVRYMNGEYARWWNRRHTHIGHVFQGRFKAQIIESGVYLLRVCRYVLLNPVRAGLVAHPGGWKWSSYRHVTGEATGDLVNVPSLLQALDPDGRPDTRLRLLDFVAGAGDDEIATFVRRDRRVIGSDRFAQQFAEDGRMASREVAVREHRLDTPTLTALLLRALEGGNTLADGVVAAHGAGYPIASIARASGLSERSVARVVRGRPQSPATPVIRLLV